MKKILAIILITIFLPNHLLAKDPKSLYPTFTKWLLDNGYNQYVDIDENGVPRHNLKIKTRKGMWQINYNANPNRDTLIYYFYRYQFSHLTGDPNTYSWIPIEIKPSKEPYKFEFDLIEDEFVKKQMKKKSMLSYLYYQDGKVLIDEITPKEKLGEFMNNETKLISMSMNKSVTSYILGHAICDGYIDSVDSKLDDWPILETSLYENQKLIDLLNMAAGDQKYIFEFGEGGQIVVDDSYDYETKNIFTTLGFYLQNTEKSESRYNYNGFITQLLINYVRFKTGDDFKKLLNKIFQNKIKNEHAVHFYELRDPSEELGISHPMIRTTRYDWLRLAKAIMDDYQNDTCVGKYLKKIYEKRISKNLSGLPTKGGKNYTEPEFNRTKSYGGQFHFDYPGLEDKVIFGLGGRGGQAILIDVENSRIVAINSKHYNDGRNKYNVKKLLIDPIKNGRKIN